MARRKYKVHFPKSTELSRSLCGMYAPGISLSGDFRNITCRECREHIGYTQAMYEFEIGEYSWGDWLARYTKPLPKIEPRAYESHTEVMLRLKLEREQREALLRKFESRAKK